MYRSPSRLHLPGSALALTTMLVCLSGCGKSAKSVVTVPQKAKSGTTFKVAESTLLVGEALFGDGNEVAHVNVIIGPKSGPAGNAFAGALANQEEGHSNFLAALAPNLAVKPSTVIVPSVTVKAAEQAVQLYGPAQMAVARAVTHSVKDGIIPKARCDDWVIVCKVLIHWEAQDDKKILEFNYEATKLAIRRALSEQPEVTDLIAADAELEIPASWQ